ncbi:hypothetical protein vBAbaPP1_75 [Acinetobacter phage vB_AbaM_P1]|nr:hypothetical protein vBAbaPP1_75 [Acinetobacter phage vB_AbaM_P1]
MKKFRFTVAFKNYNIIYNIEAVDSTEAWNLVAEKEHFESRRTTMEEINE